jgi:hypothetical protein
MTDQPFMPGAKSPELVFIEDTPPRKWEQLALFEMDTEDCE